MPNLTKNFINKLPSRLNRETIYWDDMVAGFGLKVTIAGNKSFIVQYRFHGKSRRMKIGNYGAIMPEQARNIARNMLAQTILGTDPLAQKQHRTQSPDFQKLADDYLHYHALPHKRERSIRMDKDLLNRILLPKLRAKKLAELTRRDIEPIILALKATPYTANRTRALLSKMFSLAVDWEWMEKNPARSIAKYPEHQRNRWLDKAELTRLMDALDRAEYQYSANIVRLLIYTGARKSEVLKAEWSQFDLSWDANSGGADSNGGVWVKPAHTTKQKREEHTPLSDMATALLRDIYQQRQNDTLFANSPYVFPSPKKPSQPVSHITHFWEGVIKQAQIENVRLHDLRHSFASHLVQSGVSLPIIGRRLSGADYRAVAGTYASANHNALCTFSR